MKIILIVIVTCALSACKKADIGDCFKSTGATITEKVDLSFFNTIELYDNVNLILVQDAEYSAEIIAGENLIDKVKLKQEGDLIKIRNDNSCNWVRSFKREITVRVTAPDLVLLNYFGSGDISSEAQLKYKEFNLHAWEAAGTIALDLHCPVSVFALHTGPVDLKIKGTSGVVTLYAAGFGSADMRELDVAYYFVNSQGTGNFHVLCSKQLEVRIGSAGNIYYSGNPSTINILENTGSGALIHN